jgi:hypothetical protein
MTGDNPGKLHGSSLMTVLKASAQEYCHSISSFFAGRVECSQRGVIEYGHFARLSSLATEW